MSGMEALQCWLCRVPLRGFSGQGTGRRSLLKRPTAVSTIVSSSCSWIVTWQSMWDGRILSCAEGRRPRQRRESCT